MDHQALRALRSQQASDKLKTLYGGHEGVLLQQTDRYARLLTAFSTHFDDGGGVRFFSSPGRTEIGGNHTDHNHGRVLAAAVTLDTLAAVRPTQDGWITLYSQGYAQPFCVDTRDLARRQVEVNTTNALIRGVCARMKELGFAIGGFEAAVTSDVLGGSGLSSSAAFEVLIVAVLDGLYNGGTMDGMERAKLCQWVENNYFGKPSGLMDQSACSIGGLISIDFEKPEPKVQAYRYDFAAKGMTLVVLSTRSSHDDLTDEYAAIPVEMRQVASALGGRVLREVKEADLLARLAQLRGQVSDRALLRALHFFDENRRVAGQVEALEKDDLPRFLELVVASGESSWKLLQNLYVGGSGAQSLALACELSRRMLAGRGAWRVHGGGFAGTILAFVPDALLAGYVAQMDGVFGKGACAPLGVRPVGAVEVQLD